MGFVLVDRPVAEVAVVTLNRPASELGQRIAAFSQPGVELTKKSLHAGMSATSLETYVHSEGIGQLYLRLLTDNFEEATRARHEGRPAVFRDDR